MSEMDPFDDVASAIADGTRIDWDRAESSARTESEKATIRRLRRIEQVAAQHREQSRNLTGPESASATSPESDRGAELSPLPFMSWGHLRILERVGEGAFGEVFRAWDPRLDREVALKLLRRADQPSSADPTASIEEGRLLARVRHANVVVVHGAEHIDGRTGIWTEFIHGRTLAELVRDNGCFGAEEAVAIGLDVCRALTAIHAAGLLHRDIKAQNVMREDGGRILLMDFGAGLDRLDGDELEQRPGAMGTPLYVAPEVLLGGESSVRSDIYSLGVLLYYLVTGTHPIQADSLHEVRVAQRLGRRMLLSDARPDLPGKFADVVERALSADPQDRYETAAAIEAALSEIQGAVHGADTPPTRTGLRGHRAKWMWLVATVLVVATATGGVALWRRTTAGVVHGTESRDWVLIADFENRTNEPDLGAALRAALEHELVQSRFAKVVPRIRVDDVLRLMKRPIETRLDAATAREVAVRDGDVRVVVNGRIERVDTAYVLTAALVGAADARPVASVREQAATSADLNSALRRISNGLRAALGERRSEIGQSSKKLEHVTTPSLRALYLYTESYDRGYRRDWPAALEFARQAVAEDPGFGTALIWLAWCLNNTGAQLAEVSAAAEQALARSRDTTDWERYWIEGSYFWLTANGPEDQEKAVRLYKALLELVPEHHWATGNVSDALLKMDRPREALPYAIAKAELRPTDGNTQGDALRLLLRCGDVDRAGRVVDRLRRINPQRQDVTEFPIRAAWIKRDIPTVVREMERVTQTLPSLPEQLRWDEASSLANMQYTLGRSRAATEMARLIPPNPADLNVSFAFFGGDLRPMREAVTREIGPPPAWWQNSWVELERLNRIQWLTELGLLREAERELEDLGKNGLGPRYSNSRESIDVLRGQLALKKGETVAAIMFLKRGRSRYDMGLFFYRMGFLAEALIRQGKRDEAIALLEDHRQWHYTAIIRPQWMINMLTLAELYQEAGRTVDAERLTSELSNLLSTGDSDSPLVVRLRRLQRSQNTSSSR